MIEFSYQTEFELSNKDDVGNWVSNSINEEFRKVGAINFIFCDDEYVWKLNVKYLKRKTLTDVIAFNYSEDRLVAGDIFISVDRVKDNAQKFKVDFDDEMHRIMIHGVLHLCGYQDKMEYQRRIMQKKEDYYLYLRPEFLSQYL